jgi:hypothetical protein
VAAGTWRWQRRLVLGGVGVEGEEMGEEETEQRDVKIKPRKNRWAVWWMTEKPVERWDGRKKADGTYRRWKMEHLSSF